MPEPEKDEYLYSPVVSQATTASFGVGTNLTWDSFWRQVYENSNKVIQRQANDLLKRGNLVEAEVRALVEGQRNALVLKIRQYNSPFGRLYSEIDRINAAIVRRIHGKTPLLADEHGVDQNGQRLAYADLERAVAYRHPSLAGDDLTVALDFGEGRVVVVSENDAAWRPVLSALDRHPRNKRPSTEWRLVLVAGVPEARVELLN